MNSSTSKKLFLALQCQHAATIFSFACLPPLDKGTTWSIVSFPLTLQYLQTPRDSLRICFHSSMVREAPFIFLTFSLRLTLRKRTLSGFNLVHLSAACLIFSLLRNLHCLDTSAAFSGFISRHSLALRANPSLFFLL